MNCLICRQFRIVDGVTSIIFERGETRIVINHLPARVCPGCGEAYLEQDTVVVLLQYAEEMYKTGEKNKVLEYRDICIDS
jgi:YgiT-type zinc finger domain-containing protein